MKKKNKEINYLYGYLDYVINKYDAEFFDYENEFYYIINGKFFNIVILYEDIWYFDFLYRGRNIIIENNSKNYNISYHDAINALYICLMLWTSCINKNKINKTMDFLIKVDEY